MSTLFSVGGRPGGTLPNTRGRNSTALSTEILIIISTALESKTTSAEDYGALGLGASAVFVSVHEVERNLGRSFWRPESDTPHVKTSLWHQIIEIWLLGADKVSDWCRWLWDDFIRWDLQISCSLWNKYAVPPSRALRHIDRIHLSWERWLLMCLVHMFFLTNAPFHTWLHPVTSGSHTLHHQFSAAGCWAPPIWANVADRWHGKTSDKNLPTDLCLGTLSAYLIQSCA